MKMSNVIPGPGYGPRREAAVRTEPVEHGSTGGLTNSQPLHIVTQDNQGYGSQRRCCEYCGAMCWPGMQGSARYWTANRVEWDASPAKCRLD